MAADHAKGFVPASRRSRPKNGFTVIELLVVLAIIGILVALLLPATRSAGSAARRTQCMNNLHNIAVALHNYHDTYGVLPPAYTVDGDGRPLHSWRTLILPFIEQQALYETIDLSKPWDDPANEKAAQAAVPVYRCPESTAPAGQTTYLAVAADGACFRPGQSMAYSEITDGTSQTLLVIEADPSQAVPWMAPVDANESLVLGFRPDGPLPHTGSFQAVLADGSVRTFGAETSAAVRRALITAAGDDGDQLAE